MKVAAWNVEGRLVRYLPSKDRLGTPEEIIEHIKVLNADVLVIPEAFNGKDDSREAEDRLHALGYEWFATPYDDPDREEEIALYGKSHIAIVSRIGFVSKKVIRFGGIRNLPVVKVKEPKSGKIIRIIGAHLEDRSEAQRQQQLDDMIEYIVKDSTPTILAGDLNALWPGVRASLISSFITRWIAWILPGGDLKSELSRLIEMASGSTMQRLHQEAFLNEVDARRQPTVTPKKRNLSYLPAIPLCQIDHILVSSELKSTNFKVSKDGGSDHRAISVYIEFPAPIHY